MVPLVVYGFTGTVSKLKKANGAEYGSCLKTLFILEPETASEWSHRGRYVGLRVLEVTSGCLGVCVCLCSNNNSGATWHPEVISVCPGVPCSQNRELEAHRCFGDPQQPRVC